MAVLGYHVLSATATPTQMRIRTDKFAAQMERIVQMGLPFISLEQFLAWRRGEGTLPPRSILVTLDDGWKSVYTEAFPVFKKHRIPFTIYLYTDYIDGGGRALTTAMIEEMMASGLCTVGCHSSSHPFPARVKKAAAQGSEAYSRFLQHEMAGSQKILQDFLKTPITTYAYPGGYHTPEMHQLAARLGYDHLFTVIPGKVRRDSPAAELPRYIVLGNSDAAFEAALTFRNQSTPSADGTSNLTQTPFPVEPTPSSLIESRHPVIRADFSALDDLDPTALEMRVGGFGKVPAHYDPATKLLTWKVQRSLRQPNTTVEIHWKRQNQSRPETPVTWSFRLDPVASYLRSAESPPTP